MMHANQYQQQHSSQARSGSGSMVSNGNHQQSGAIKSAIPHVPDLSFTRLLRIGGRSQNVSSSAPSSYQSTRHHHHPQHQQQHQAPLTMAGAPTGLYYPLNSQMQSAAQAAVPQPFVMLSQRLPANFATPGVQYANQPQDSSLTAIPVTMPISYTSIPGPAGVQPMAYLVSGMPSAGGGGNSQGLLPVPYATYPGPAAPGTLTLPAAPFPATATYSSVSYDPSTSCMTSYPEYRLLTSSSSSLASQGMSHTTGAATQVPAVAAAAPSSFSKQSPSPTGQQGTSDPTTPPLMAAPVNPHYFSGYTICAPPPPPGTMVPAPLTVNQFCQMAGGMNPGPPMHYQHQYHQPRSRNPHHNGPKNHFRSS